MAEEFNHVYIDESKPDVEINLSLENTIVTFHNDDENEVNKEELFSIINNIPNKENVQVISIESSSSLENLKIASFFSNIKRLVLWGANLKNLSGIEDLKRLEEISIESKSNKKRKLDGIEHLGLSDLSVVVTNKKDLEIISKCDSLRFLKLEGAFDIDFRDFLQLSLLERMVLVNRRIEGISNLNCMKNLKKLEIAYCSKLTRFEENNENLEVLWVEACNRLNLNSITQLKNLTLLILMTQKNISDLNFVMNLHKLKDLIITATNLSSTNLGAIKASKSLEEVWLSANNKIIENIGKSNRNLLISNGDIHLKNGIEISFEEYCNNQD